MTSPANGRHRQPEIHDTDQEWSVALDEVEDNSRTRFLTLQSTVGELARQQMERGSKIATIEEELATAKQLGTERSRRIETLEAEVNRLKALVAVHHPDTSSGGSRPVLRVISGGDGPMIIAFDWARIRELLWRPKLRVAWGAAFAAIVLLVAVQLATGAPGGRPVHHVAEAPEVPSKVVYTTIYVPRPVAEQHLTTLLQSWTHLRTWLRKHKVATPPSLLSLPANVFNMPVTRIKVVVDQDQDAAPATSSPSPAISPTPGFTSPSPTASPTPSPTINAAVNSTASPTATP